MDEIHSTDNKLGLVRALSAFFDQRPEVIVAYLFGSQARDQAGPLSDVDIAVLLADGDPHLEQTLDYQLSLWDHLAAVLEREDIDVVLLNVAPLLLRHRVLQEGLLVSCKDGRRRVSFAEKTIRDYLDTQYLRLLERAYTNKRIQAGRFGYPVHYKRLPEATD